MAGEPGVGGRVVSAHDALMLAMVIGAALLILGLLLGLAWLAVWLTDRGTWDGDS